MNVKYYVQPVFLAPFYTLADRNIAERSGSPDSVSILYIAVAFFT